MNPVPYFPLCIALIHHRIFGGDYWFPRHAKTIHQMYAVLEGRVFFELSGGGIEIGASEALLLAPGVSRKPVARSKQGAFLTVVFESPWLTDFAEKPATQLLVAPEAMKTAHAMVREFEGKNSPHVQHVLFHSFCLQLLGPGIFRKLDAVPSEGPATRLNFERRKIEEAEAIMEGNLDRPIPLNELAGLIHSSRSNLARYFRKHRGCSPHARYREIRLESARKLLLNTASPITEIAFQHGFSSSQHFSSSFKERYGISPARYRKETDRSEWKPRRSEQS